MKLRIKELLKEKGVTTYQLAEHLGVTQPTVSSTMNGNPNFKWLNQVADFLGVNFMELFIDDDSAVSGFIKIKGIIHEIHSMEELKRLIVDNDNQ